MKVVGVVILNLVLLIMGVMGVSAIDELIFGIDLFNSGWWIVLMLALWKNLDGESLAVIFVREAK
jgi:hypothetical protein